jgi:hypothetical protein
VPLNEKDAGSGETGKPDSPPSEQTPFQRFEEFARRVVSVPRTEIEERERAYQESRARAKVKT